MATLDLNKIGSTLSLGSPSQVATPQTFIPTPVVPKTSNLLTSNFLPSTQVSNFLPTIPTTINSTNLTSTPTVNLPSKPTSDYNSGGILAGGNAEIQALANYTTPNGAKLDAQGNVITPTPTQTDRTSGVPNSMMALLQKYFPTKPASGVDQYNQLETQAGIDAKTAAVNQSNQELQALNAQLQGINSQAAVLQASAGAGGAIENQLQLDSTGRGRTAAGVAPLQADELRKNNIQLNSLAVQALPLQAQILAKQAEASGNKAMLDSAQKKLDTLFDIYQQDAKNQNQYQTDVYNSIKDFVDKEEARIIDERKTKDTQDFQVMRDQIGYAQDLAKTAFTNGQSSLGAQIAQLDPKDPNYMQKVSQYASQIQPKASSADTQVIDVGGKKVLINSATGATIKEFGSSDNPLVGLTPVQQSDPFIQKLLSTAGGKALTDTPLQQINKGLTVLGQLGALQTNINNTKTGPILGAFKGANPWDTNAQTIKAQLNAVVPNLARGIYGEVGVLTDNDIKTYSSTIGNLTNTNDVNNAIMYITLDLIGKSIKNTLEVQAAGGRDVSKFVDIYTNMEDTKNSILQSLPAQGTKSLKDLGVTKSEEDLFDSTLGISGSTNQTTSFGGFFSNIWKGLTGQ